MEQEVQSVDLLGLRILHVGINVENEDEAWSLAGEFKEKMGFIPRDNNLTIFASPLIGIMKKDGPGTKGHIAIGCRNLEESLAYLTARGLTVDEATTRKYDPDGSLRVAYFKEEVGGFAYHLKEYKE